MFEAQHSRVSLAECPFITRMGEKVEDYFFLTGAPAKLSGARGECLGECLIITEMVE